MVSQLSRSKWLLHKGEKQVLLSLMTFLGIKIKTVALVVTAINFKENTGNVQRTFYSIIN